MLLEKPPVILFDDMPTDWKPFGSINKALTVPPHHPPTSLFLSTGNNVVPIRNMRRRVVTIRLAPKSDAASLRKLEHDPYKFGLRSREVAIVRTNTCFAPTLPTIGKHLVRPVYCRRILPL